MFSSIALFKTKSKDLEPVSIFFVSTSITILKVLKLVSKFLF